MLFSVPGLWQKIIQAFGTLRQLSHHFLKGRIWCPKLKDFWVWLVKTHPHELVRRYVHHHPFSVRMYTHPFPWTPKKKKIVQASSRNRWKCRPAKEMESLVKPRNTTENITKTKVWKSVSFIYSGAKHCSKFQLAAMQELFINVKLCWFPTSSVGFEEKPNRKCHPQITSN